MHDKIEFRLGEHEYRIWEQEPGQWLLEQDCFALVTVKLQTTRERFINRGTGRPRVRTETTAVLEIRLGYSADLNFTPKEAYMFSEGPKTTLRAIAKWVENGYLFRTIQWELEQKAKAAGASDSEVWDVRFPNWRSPSDQEIARDLLRLAQKHEKVNREIRDNG